MKRLFTLVVSVLALVVASCSYDDTAVWNKVNSLEDRVAKLEELCKKANSDIEALQTIVEALQQNDYVVSVAPVIEGGKTVGYTITFAKSGEVTIYNGKDGKDDVNGDGGYIPNIGVKKDVDGIYYWTLDGEWLLDESGNKVPAQGEQGADGAQGEQGEQGQPGEDGQDGQDGQDGKDGKDGVTPKLKIENDYWYVSYDNGATWSVVGKATAEGTSAGDSIFERVEVENDCVIFYLTDGSSFTLPINNQTDGDIIRFLDNAVKIRCVMNWDTDGDNELSKAEAAKVTSLDGVFSSECDAIVAFDELKYFTGLTEIEPYAFYRAFNLHKITLPESIKSIGECAFEYCSRLKQLTIPDGVTKIGYGAFAGCRSLKSITIPGSVEEIQVKYEEGYYEDGEFYIDYANPFEDCYSLEAIYSPYASDGRSLIMDNTLIYVASKGINEYTIPAEVKSVANYALGSADYDYNEVRFPKVVIPESVEYIDAYGLLAAEYHFESMTPPSMHEYALGGVYQNSISIYVPDGALEAYLAGDWSREYKQCIRYSIDDIPASNIIKYTTTHGGLIDYLNNSNNVASHTLIDGVGYIVYAEPVTKVESLFSVYGERVLTITLPDSVTEIGNYAFEDYYSLESINIPEGVTTIGSAAFLDCRSLTSITIPSSVTTFGSAVFYGCQGELIVNCNLPNQFTEDDFQENKLIFYGACFTKVTIGNNVTEIGEWAFYACSSITDVIIGSSVTRIGFAAFADCHNIKSINLPEGLKEIGGISLSHCYCIESIIIPDSVTDIKYGAFQDCDSLTSVIIGSGVTSIEATAFWSCDSLESVYCKAITPPAGGVEMFNHNASNRMIYVPYTSVDEYISAEYWADYASSIVAYDFENDCVYVSDAVKAWLGTYTAYTEQLIDFSGDNEEIINQRTDFTFTVSEYEGESGWYLVSGFSVLGENIPTLGQIIENDGVSYLIISNMIQYSDVGDGYYATWVSFCDVSDGSQTFVTGDFDAMTFAMSADGTIEYTAGAGELNDGREFVVSAHDIVAFNSTKGSIALFTSGEVWKYGDIKGVTKVDSPSTLAMSASKKQLKVGDVIPSSMVVAM